MDCAAGASCCLSGCAVSLLLLCCSALKVPSSSVKKGAAVTQFIQQVVQGNVVWAVICWLSTERKKHWWALLFVAWTKVLYFHLAYQRGGQQHWNHSFPHSATLLCCSQCFSFLGFHVFSVSPYMCNVWPWMLLNVVWISCRARKVRQSRKSWSWDDATAWITVVPLALDRSPAVGDGHHTIQITVFIAHQITLRHANVCDVCEMIQWVHYFYTQGIPELALCNICYALTNTHIYTCRYLFW